MPARCSNDLRMDASAEGGGGFPALLFLCISFVPVTSLF
jgi:hypothetical protein